MNPAELFELFAGFAEHAKQRAFQSQLVDAPGISIRAVENLPRSRCDADRPRRAGRLRAFDILGRLVADGSTRGISIEGHIDLDLAQKFPIAVENLDSAVAAIADVDISLRIGGDGVRRVELARLVAALAPGL